MNKALEIRRKFLTDESFVTRLIGLVIPYVPALLKYGRSYVETRRMLLQYESSKFDVQNFVNSKLADLISRFNTTKYAECRQIHLDARDALAMAPLMRVTDLPSNPRELCPQNEDKLDVCSTSGSSGVPKVFYLGSDRGPVETAFVHHAWKKSGFRHTQSRAVLRGLDAKGAGELFKWNPILQELQISPFLLNDSNSLIVWEEIKRRNIRFIHGYPSSMEVLASALKNQSQHDTHVLKIRGLLLISEQIYEHQRILFSAVFPEAKQVSFFGQSEKVAFAFQDPSDPNIYHFSPLYGIVELLNDSGEKIEDKGASGMLYATGLLFKGSSFVRYELGDTAELVELPTAANQFTLSVRNIKSWRASHPIVGSSGERFSLAAVNMHVRELLDVSRMQLIQRQPGELEVYLVTRDGKDRTSAKVIAEKLQAKVGDSLSVRTFYVDEIQLNSRGKAKLFISFLGGDG